MIDQRQAAVRDTAVFVLLVAIGVAGRWGQPEWCFTPTAAAAIFAGRFFPRLAVACCVPIGILLLSDLLLPAYSSLPVMLLTYAAMTLPVGLGRMLRNEHRGAAGALRWAACGLLPAALFYLVTNFAVWAFQSDYEKNLAGLVACYGAAVPFFRWMLLGDLFYLVVLFGCLALARLPLTGRPQLAPAAEK